MLFISKVYSQQSQSDFKPKLLRFEENYENISDSLKNQKSVLKFKNIPLSDSKQSNISFGFDFRELYEYVKGFETTGAEDGYWLHRFAIHSDLKLKGGLRAFIQLGSGFISQRSLPQRPVDKDELFLLDGFLEYQTKSKSYIRVGRQELFFGMGRLIAPREGPNIRNSFDAIRVHKNFKGLSSDAFFSFLVNNRPFAFDNQVFGDNQQLWGLYNTFKVKRINVDAYYIGFNNKRASFNSQAGIANEIRHSVGLRLKGNLSKSTSYDSEALYQFGKFGAQTIGAYLADFKVNQSFSISQVKFQPSFKFTYASGDQSASDNKLNTYNPLFPNLLYYQTAIGIFPSNFLNPQVNLGFAYKNLSIVSGGDIFWRARKQDGIYAPFGTINLNNGSEKYLGYQLYSKWDYPFNTNLTGTFLISRYFKSDFIRNNPDRRGVDLLVNVLLNIKI